MIQAVKPDASKWNPTRTSRRSIATVDQQLGYRTRSLLCVPLRGGTGELLGAFELINKRQANFTAEDQAGLIELAAHAAIALENSQEHQQLLHSRRQIVDQAARRMSS